MIAEEHAGVAVQLQLTSLLCDLHMHTTLPQLCKDIYHKVARKAHDKYSIHIHHMKEENRFEIVLYLVGTEVPTDVSLACSFAESCKAPSSNGEAR